MAAVWLASSHNSCQPGGVWEWGLPVRIYYNVTKTTAKRRWGHWTSKKLAANEWNSLDLSLRETASLSSFKQNPSKVTGKVPVNK